MKTVTAIIEALATRDAGEQVSPPAALLWLREHAIKLERPHYMPLCIEWVGTADDDHADLISVAHYYEQEGDLMRDPDIVFKLPAGLHGEWLPISYRQDGLGINRDLTTSRRLQRDCASFCRDWNTNLNDQGFFGEAQAGRNAARA